MTQEALYQKLVDLYVGDELPEELAEDLQAAAFGNPALAHDIRTLRQTLGALQSVPAPVLSQKQRPKAEYHEYINNFV